MLYVAATHINISKAQAQIWPAPLKQVTVVKRLPDVSFFKYLASLARNTQHTMKLY